MQEAVAVREAALDAVDDVVPDALRADIESFVVDGSLVPGVLTLLSARAAGAHAPAGTGSAEGSDGTDGADGADSATDDGGSGPGEEFEPAGDLDVDAVEVDGASASAYSGDADGLAGRAAGVQLIYDGLRLTRRLVHAEPWPEASGSGAAGSLDGEGVAADMDILVADVLVARGFYLLARTEAATVAVDVVRSFGRDQTERRETADPALDRELERDVLRLAVVAGVTAAGREPSTPDALVGDLAAAYDDGFPAPETLFDQQVRERVAGVVGAQAVNRND
jgi:hypothetical protein